MCIKLCGTNVYIKIKEKCEQRSGGEQRAILYLKEIHQMKEIKFVMTISQSFIAEKSTICSSIVFIVILIFVGELY